MRGSSTTPREQPYYLTYSKPSDRWLWRLSLTAAILLILGVDIALAYLIYLIAHMF